MQRDKKAWCCTTVLPSLFVLAGLLLLEFISPQRNLSPLDLKSSFNTDFNAMIETGIRNPIPYNTPGFFSCNPGYCTQSPSFFSINETGETYSFCGAPVLSDSPGENCSISDSDQIVSRINEAGADEVGGDVTTINEVRASLPFYFSTLESAISHFVNFIAFSSHPAFFSARRITLQPRNTVVSFLLMNLVVWSTRELFPQGTCPTQILWQTNALMQATSITALKLNASSMGPVLDIRLPTTSHHFTRR